MYGPMRRNIFQEDHYNKVFEKVMETAGVIISYNCSEIIVRYLEEFEGVLTLRGFKCLRPTTTKR